MDLGPKRKFLSEVSTTGKFDGYIMNKMVPTTFKDVSDILSFFIVARLVDGFSIKGVKAFFDRRDDNQKADGDFVQMLSINSEIGVYPFDAGNYDGNDLYSYSEMKGPNVIGIFFSSDTQIRDYITPKRTILTSDGPITSNCSFDEFDIFTQEVPFYQWIIQKKGKKGVDTIFGQQTNTWFTDELVGGGGSFFKHKYQKLDRIESASRYMRTTNQSKTDYFKGYIYSVDSAGVTSAFETYWDKNNPDARKITVGAPFFFYYGIKQGKTAYDTFGQKWLDYDDITF
jgi:hypothetical protein